MIESCLMVALLCLLLFGALQAARVYLAAETLDYAAACGARARAVGFNRFMVYKTVRAAAIPTAGPMTHPGFDRPAGPSPWASERPGALWDLALRSATRTPQTDVEYSRIPLYLGARWWGELDAILDYADWNTVDGPFLNEQGADMAEVTVRQDCPLRFPFARAFYAADSVPLEGRAAVERHSDLYLE